MLLSLVDSEEAVVGVKVELREGFLLVDPEVTSTYPGANEIQLSHFLREEAAPASLIKLVKLERLLGQVQIQSSLILCELLDCHCNGVMLGVVAREGG